MTDPYTYSELEALLPLLPQDEPILETKLNSGDKPHRIAYTTGSGKAKIHQSAKRTDITALTLPGIISNNVKRLREALHDDDDRWTAAAANRMLHALTKGQLFTSTDIVAKIERGERGLRAEELIWLCILYQVPIWDLLVPRIDETADLTGYFTDRHGLLRALTHLDPETIDRMDPDEYSGDLRALKDLENTHLRDAANELANVQFEESRKTHAPIEVSLDRGAATPSGKAPAEKRSLESEEEEDLLLNIEAGGVPVSEYEAPEPSVISRLDEIGEQLAEIMEQVMGNPIENSESTRKGTS